MARGAFATLRRESPIHFFEENEYPPFPKGPGYYAITRYDDVWHVSRNPQLFCSGRPNIRDLPIEIAEFFGSMIAMDDPRHNRLRSIVAKGFTPKVVSQVEEYVRQKATGIVDNLLERYPDGELRLRRGGRRPPAAADHLRDDGHPRRGREAGLRLDEHHPRRRRPRVRRRRSTSC